MEVDLQGGKMLNSNFTRYLFSKGGTFYRKFFEINLSDTTSGYQILKKFLKNCK